MSKRRAHGSIRFAVFFFLASALFPSLSQAQVPVFKITTEDSSIKFSVKASVAVNGTFNKWDAALTFTSTDVSTGVLDIKIQPEPRQYRKWPEGRQVDGQRLLQRRSGSVDHFVLKKIVQTGPTTFDLQGDFTIPGATKPQTLTLTVSGAGTGSGEIHGNMVFDRKDNGMNKRIPFVRIGDKVD